MKGMKPDVSTLSSFHSCIKSTIFFFFAMTARLANKTSYQDKGFGNKVLFSP